ncbi:tetratricopeptide repeat protein [Nonomuraea jabiensis]|uniref:tetratricopeptide repeat protein n=1 Tax=Nonomuraea jabiensis TaxID=882448 RepID=UPI00367D611B
MSEQESSIAQTGAIFAGYLKLAREAAWNPSAAWLARHSGIPQSTVESLISGRRKRLPDWSSQVEPLLRAYQRKVQDDQRGHPNSILGSLAAWKQVYDDAQNNRSTASPMPLQPVEQSTDRTDEHHSHWMENDSVTHGPGRPIRQVRPLDLEVHPAIDAGAAAVSLGPLPAYIGRTHDVALASMVAEVQRLQDVQICVLVGESSTGKTRACWEAVRDLPEPWRLWHPLRPDRPEAALADLDSIGSHIVIWLNEAQHYLLTPASPSGEQVAAALRDLLATPERGPVLVLATLWPAYWDILTRMPAPGLPDPHAQARELIKNHSIRIPAAFTGPDLVAATLRADCVGDPRLIEALARAQTGALTQYLAGGPALIERYENATVATRAVVHAAMDARRLGHGPALSRSLLEEAAAGYLTDEQWEMLADDWLEQAFAYLTDPLSCRGARAPLTRIRPRPGVLSSQAKRGEGDLSYRLADFLEEYGARARRLICPPSSFWQAISQHAALDDRTTLAEAARRRGRLRHAEELGMPSESPDRNILEHLRKASQENKQTEKPSPTSTGRASVNAHATWHQRPIHQLSRAPSLAETAGSTKTSKLTFDTKFEDIAALESLEWEACEADPTYLANMENTFSIDDDRQQYTQVYQLVSRADTDDPYMMVAISRTLFSVAQPFDLTHHREEDRRILSEAKGDFLVSLAEAYEKLGDSQSAEFIICSGLNEDSIPMMRAVANKFSQEGNLAEAIILYRRAASANDTESILQIVQLLEQEGRRAEAKDFAFEIAETGNTAALRKLIELMENSEDLEELDQLARDSFDAGYASALRFTKALPWVFDAFRFGLDADGSISHPSR